MKRFASLAVLLLACSKSESAPPAPANDCVIPTMTEQYGGEESPATFTPGIAAPACVKTKHDAIIVLGCPNDPDGKPSACQTARADITMKVIAAGLGEEIITTGGAVQNQWIEAETLRDLLVARGVARERISIEPKAEHTDENLYFSTRIMEARGFTNAIVVTEDPRHLVMTAVCDSNCCVKLGRLTVFDYALDGAAAGNASGAAMKLGHYELHPRAPEVTTEECETIKPKLMCLPLGGRRSCKDRFALDASTD